MGRESVAPGFPKLQHRLLRSHPEPDRCRFLNERFGHGTQRRKTTPDGGRSVPPPRTPWSGVPGTFAAGRLTQSFANAIVIGFSCTSKDRHPCGSRRNGWKSRGSHGNRNARPGPTPCTFPDGGWREETPQSQWPSDDEETREMLGERTTDRDVLIPWKTLPRGASNPRPSVTAASGLTGSPPAGKAAMKPGGEVAYVVPGCLDRRSLPVQSTKRNGRTRRTRNHLVEFREGEAPAEPAVLSENRAGSAGDPLSGGPVFGEQATGESRLQQGPPQQPCGGRRPGLVLLRHSGNVEQEAQRPSELTWRNCQEGETREPRVRGMHLFSVTIRKPQSHRQRRKPCGRGRAKRALATQGSISVRRGRDSGQPFRRRPNRRAEIQDGLRGKPPAIASCHRMTAVERQVRSATKARAANNPAQRGRPSISRVSAV